MIEQQKVAANFLQVKDMNAQCKNFDCEVIVLQPGKCKRKKKKSTFLHKK
jgi:hypothetical protein